MNFIDRKIIFHGPHFTEFYLKQTRKIQLRIEHVFRIIRQMERVPEKYLKHLEGTNSLFEIRVESGSNTFRIFCCFDKGSLVVLFNGFQKKAQKTPRNEIELAERLKKEYFLHKHKNK